jgi:hypothetical protein
MKVRFVGLNPKRVASECAVEGGATGAVVTPAHISELAIARFMKFPYRLRSVKYLRISVSVLVVLYCTYAKLYILVSNSERYASNVPRGCHVRGHARGSMDTAY